MMDIASLPKVLLHDHLDGGLRPATVADLAADIGYEGLAGSDPESIAAALFQGESGSLEEYLEAFRHTLAVMQSADAIERVAHEAVEDLAADGVVYAEIRFAPGLLLEGGLSRSEAARAALAGLRSGTAATGTTAFAILDAMRQADDSVEIARLAVELGPEGVVGFDLAGPEQGYPASGHAASCALVAGRLGLTLHAGEGDGPASIADALDCGAERIGHGVRIIEDCTVRDGRIADLGPVAQRVHGRRTPLEICPWSNVHTLGIEPKEHPVGMLHRAGFVVTLNTDNRLMSGTSMSDEFRLVVEQHGFTTEDLRTTTLAAIDAAFCSPETRASVRERVVAGYEAA